MPITKHDKQALDQLYSDWCSTYSGHKEDYFAILYLTKKFQCNVPDVAEQVCFGGCDFGIDAYRIDRAARNLYLFQFKWSENHGLFKDSMDRLAKDGLERIFGNPQRLEEVASQKIGYAVSKARNLIWALLIQGLFNDPKLGDLLEEFGTNLKKEAAFREHLRKLASSRLLPILKEVLARPEHANRMANEKYDFLRSKEIFNQCKDFAYERFKWAKKSL